MSTMDLAVLVAEPQLALPTSLWLALSVVCIVAVGLALRTEKKSGASPRMYSRR